METVSLCAVVGGTERHAGLGIGFPGSAIANMPTGDS